MADINIYILVDVLPTPTEITTFESVENDIPFFSVRASREDGLELPENKGERKPFMAMTTRTVSLTHSADKNANESRGTGLRRH